MTLWEILGPLWDRLRGRTPSPVTPDIEWTRLTAPLGRTAAALPHQRVGNQLVPICLYRHYRKRKKGGGYREISEPAPQLKQVQQEILARYLAPLSPHPAAVAYRYGHSTADHVWTHAGGEILITVDLADFFPSTSEARVDDWWHEQVGSTGPARLLTQLTTAQGGLPQGAPTSPALSNLVNLELDDRMQRRAEFAGARYTRYCDDLAFSWPRGVEPPSDFRPAITSLLLEYGYRLHPTKGWRIYRRTDEPEVTGAILTRNGRVRLPNRLKQVMARLAESADTEDGQRLAGYRAYETLLTRKRPPVQVSAPVPPPLVPVHESTMDHEDDDVDIEDDVMDPEDDENAIPF